jgi:hypothetical protein
MVWPSQVHDPSHAPWVSDCHFGHQGNTLGNTCQSEMFIAGYRSVETVYQLNVVQVEELQRSANAHCQRMPDASMAPVPHKSPRKIDMRASFLYI